MPLFPAYIDLSHSSVLVVGGGNVALRKVEKLLNFTRNITIVAPRVVRELELLAREKDLVLKRRKFLKGDLKGKSLVIVAVDDLSLQREIFEMCSKKGILCNSVDSPKYCSFIFPSLIVRGDLVIGINTAGRAPALSKKVRELIEECLPSNVREILEKVAEEREKLPKGKDRQKASIELVDRLFRDAKSGGSYNL